MTHLKILLLLILFVSCIHSTLYSQKIVVGGKLGYSQSWASPTPDEHNASEIVGLNWINNIRGVIGNSFDDPNVYTGTTWATFSQGMLGGELFLNYQLHKKWYLSTRLNLNRNVHKQAFYASNHKANFFYEVRTKFRYAILQLPIGLKYNILKTKFHPYVGAYIVPGIAVSAREIRKLDSISYINGEIINGGWLLEKKSYYTPVNRFQLHYDIAVGFEYLIKDKWILGIEGNMINYILTPYKTTSTMGFTHFNEDHKPITYKNRLEWWNLLFSVGYVIK